MLVLVHIEDVPCRWLGAACLPGDLLTPSSDLLIVEAHPESEGLRDLAVQLEQILEESVVENTHLTELSPRTRSPSD